MKKGLFKILLITATVGLLPSCNWLDLAPIDYYGAGSYWTNESHIEGNMISLHSDIRADYSMLNLLGEMRGGTYRSAGGTIGGAAQRDVTPKTNALTASVTGIGSWYGLYTNIMEVNLFIQNVEGEGNATFLSEESKGKYLGQAYGIRAYYYFWLYRTYGGVPLIESVKVLEGKVSAPDLYTARATPKETLDFIKSDINKSETYFGSDLAITSSKANWSASATLILKGEIYLWSAKVTTGNQTPDASDAATAKSALTKVEGKFSLLSDFAEIFSKKDNNEAIMSIRFVEGETSNNTFEWLENPTLFIDIFYGRDGKLISTDILKQNGSGGAQRHEYKRGLFDSFKAEDSRRDKTFLDYYRENEEDEVAPWTPEKNFIGVVARKNLGIINSTNNRVYQGDIHIYRYADVLLLLAEAENALGGSPAKYINQIRERAYGDNYAANIYVDGNFAENELAILAERDKEFVQEGKRWFDVVRLQDANKQPLVFDVDVNYYTELGEDTLPILDKSTEAHELLWPIDVSTLNNDPLVEQTPGY